jgi:hypothetical protein
MKTLQQINEGLCKKPGSINEFVLVAAKDVSVVTEAKGAAAGRYRAKVGQADKTNQNERIYPRELWAVQIERAKGKIAAGQLTGAVDHPGWGSGALKDTCIIWHSLVMDATGAVSGEFSIVTKHSRGADLQALVDANVAIGFSTRGVGSARRPTDDEKQRYGIGDDDCCTVIIDSDYELKKIDSVDDPSVSDATIDITPPASAGDEANKQSQLQENVMFKTLDELKTQAPALHTLHEAAITAAVTAATKPLTEQVAALTAERDEAKKAVDVLNGVLESAKTVKGVAIPFRETTTKEVQEKLDAANTKATKAESDLAAEKSKREAAEQKLAAEEGKRADGDRRSATLAKLDDSLKENAFAEQIGKLIKGVDGKGGKIEDAKFDVAAMEAFVAEKTAEYESIAKPANENHGITGIEKVKPAARKTGERTGADVRRELSL